MNFRLLGRELRDLATAGYDVALTGFGLADIDELLRPFADAGAGLSDSLAEPFLAPAITTFDARQGWWQDRKRAWIALGIQSDLGRGAAPGGSPRPAARTVNGKTV